MRVAFVLLIYICGVFGEAFYPYEEKKPQSQREINQTLFERETFFKKDTFLKEKRNTIIEQSKYNEYKNLKKIFK